MRRRFQFRLRTLLIAVTLLAAQCAFVMWFIRDREHCAMKRSGVFARKRWPGCTGSIKCRQRLIAFAHC